MQCNKCQTTKPENEFYFRKRGDRKVPYSNCKECEKSDRKAKRVHSNKLERERYKNDSDYREQKKARSRDATRRGAWLKSQYGITKHDYNTMFTEQEGCCKICGSHVSELTKNLSVDHIHDNGYVRGLLCGNCNRGIGLLKDNPEYLQRAAEYVQTSGRYDADTSLPQQAGNVIPFSN